MNKEAKKACTDTTIYRDLNSYHLFINLSVMYFYLIYYLSSIGICSLHNVIIQSKIGVMWEFWLLLRKHQKLILWFWFLQNTELFWYGFLCSSQLSQIKVSFWQLLLFYASIKKQDFTKCDLLLGLNTLHMWFFLIFL